MAALRTSPPPRRSGLRWPRSRQSTPAAVEALMRGGRRGPGDGRTDSAGFLRSAARPSPVGSGAVWACDWTPRGRAACPSPCVRASRASPEAFHALDLRGFQGADSAAAVPDRTVAPPVVRRRMARCRNSGIQPLAACWRRAGMTGTPSSVPRGVVVDPRESRVLPAATSTMLRTPRRWGSRAR
jgi:hypothetical protein